MLDDYLDDPWLAALVAEDARRAELSVSAGVDPLAHLHWAEWHHEVLPQFFPCDYADFHREFWDWLYGITPEVAPRPFFAMWGRGLTKSTAAESGIVNLGARKLRWYWLLVSETQSQADDHVTNVSSMLETSGIERHYPHLGAPKVGKHGNQRGWRRNRVWTSGGLVVDALGLDSAARGAKLEERRPDGLVLDDVDGRYDSPTTVEKKEGAIAAAILPALAANAAIIVAQNYTHMNSIAARLEDGRADYLKNRILSGPHAAVEEMRVAPNPGFDPTNQRSPSHKIVAGVPSWPAGFPLEEAELRITRVGLHVFETEYNHKRSDQVGALWNTGLLDRTRWAEPPRSWLRKAVGIDPNKTGRQDDAGVVVCGIAEIEGQIHGFILEDASQLSKPSEWRDSAADQFVKHRAGCFVVEGTGLGEHAELTITGAPAFRSGPPPVERVEARLGKHDRARPIARLWEDGRVHIVGHWPYLEQQMTTWVPGRTAVSPGGVDAMVHCLTHMMLDENGVIREWSATPGWAVQQETVDGQRVAEPVPLDWSRP